MWVKWVVYYTQLFNRAALDIYDSHSETVSIKSAMMVFGYHQNLHL